MWKPPFPHSSLLPLLPLSRPSRGFGGCCDGNRSGGTILANHSHCPWCLPLARLPIMWVTQWAAAEVEVRESRCKVSLACQLLAASLASSLTPRENPSVISTVTEHCRGLWWSIVFHFTPVNQEGCLNFYQLSSVNWKSGSPLMGLVLQRDNAVQMQWCLQSGAIPQSPSGFLPLSSNLIGRFKGQCWELVRNHVLLHIFPLEQQLYKMLLLLMHVYLFIPQASGSLH